MDEFFQTDRWQQMEREAQADIDAGRVRDLSKEGLKGEFDAYIKAFVNGEEHALVELAQAARELKLCDTLGVIFNQAGYTLPETWNKS